MRRAVRLLALLSYILGAAPAAAQLDQSQESFDNAHFISIAASAWQTFTPGVSGRLTAVDLHVNVGCIFPPCLGTSAALDVRIAETSGGVPSGAVLGTMSVPGVAETGGFIWLPVDFTGAQVELQAGTLYAIHLASAGTLAPESPFWSWAFDEGGDPYANGALFSDGDNSDGLDDPSGAAFPDSDATFRTYMEEVCGDGFVGAGEECDDGNTAGGDGCSAACLDEVCGDGTLSAAAETCDDGGTVDGDGCSASCALEKSGLACQQAIAKAGQKYASARLAALQKCRLGLAGGKTLSVGAPGECPQETAAAKSIGKAASQARKGIAGNKPKCSDALVAALGACAETVDALISADASGGCLRASHDAAVEAMIEAEFGY